MTDRCANCVDHDRSVYAVLHLVFVVLRVLHLPVLLWALSTPRITFEPVTPPTENDALLPSSNGGVTSSSSNYGATTTASSQVDNETANQNGGSNQNKDQKKGSGKKDGTGIPAGTPLPPSDITWSEWFARFARLVPFLWPSKSGKLQILAALCFVILILGRAVNVFVPRTLGSVVEALSSWAKPGPTICEPKNDILYLCHHAGDAGSSRVDHQRHGRLSSSTSLCVSVKGTEGSCPSSTKSS